MKKIKTLLFYIILALSALLWCLISFVITPFLNFKTKCHFISKVWCKFAIWLSKKLLNITYKIDGLEHIPSEPCLIVSNHQSTWETFFITSYFSPLSHILKKEIKKIPFFGWAISLTKPIAIDRKNPKKALKEVFHQGVDRLNNNQWVLIFPEGTRVSPKENKPFSRSGAAIAANTQKPILPIAHNAGEFWPNSGWIKKPGIIQVKIGPLYYAEDSSPQAIKKLNSTVEQWIKRNSRF